MATQETVECGFTTILAIFSEIPPTRKSGPDERLGRSVRATADPVCGNCSKLTRKRILSDVYTHIDIHFGAGRGTRGVDSSGAIRGSARKGVVRHAWGAIRARCGIGNPPHELREHAPPYVIRLRHSPDSPPSQAGLVPARPACRPD